VSPSASVDSSAAITLPPTGATILTLEGAGSSRSEPFDVDEDWALSWERRGSRLFSIQLIPADVDVFGELVVSTTRPTAGDSPMHRPGRFVVQVHATEPWTIRIIDFLPTPARSIPAVVSGTGPTNSEVFFADQPFLIEWTADGSVPFGIELVTMTTLQPLLVAADAPADASCHQVSLAEEFYLHVVANGEWTIALRPSEGEAVCPAD